MPMRTEKYWSDDLPSPHHHVSLLARSQSSTFQFSLARVLPSCFRLSCLICHGITVLNIVLSMCSSGIPTTLYMMGKTRGKVSVRSKVIKRTSAIALCTSFRAVRSSAAPVPLSTTRSRRLCLRAAKSVTSFSAPSASCLCNSKMGVRALLCRRTSGRSRGISPINLSQTRTNSFTVSVGNEIYKSS